MASHGASGGQAQRALFTPAGEAPAQRRAEKRLGETPEALPPGLRRKGEAAAGTGSRVRSKIAVVRSAHLFHCSCVRVRVRAVHAALLFAGADAHSLVPIRPPPMLPGAYRPGRCRCSVFLSQLQQC